MNLKNQIGITKRKIIQLEANIKPDVHVPFYVRLELKYCRNNLIYLRALNIIFEKNVDMKYFKDCKTLEEYNKYCDELSDEKSLTQEEFNLLKEVSK